MIESLLEPTVSLVLLASWRAVPLLAIALVVDLLLARRLAARHHACLWTLVTIRLLVPVSFATPLSLQGPIDRWTFGSLEQESARPQILDDREMRYEAAYLLPVNAPAKPEEWHSDQPTVATAIASPTVIIQLVVIFWLLVAGAVLLRACIAHVRFARRLKHCPELTEPAVIDLVLRECDDLGIGRRPRPKEVPGFAAPAVFGLLHATICLPPGLLVRLEHQAFRWVLRHELAHLRQFDTWTLSLASIMHAIHWFNPCAWLVVSKLRIRAEQAADEHALRGAPSADAVAYGRLLLDFAELATRPRRAPALGFVPFITKQGLRHRVDRLTRPIPQPGRPLRWLLGVALLFITITGLSDARPPAIAEPKNWLTETGLVEYPADGDGPTSRRSYDVTALLDKLREREPGTDVERSLIRYACHVAAQTPKISEGRLSVEATEKQHRALTEELDAMSRSGPQQIATELRMLQVDLALATPIAWKASPFAVQQQSSSPGPMLFAQIDDTQLGALVRAAQSDRRSQILRAPKVTAFNGQTVTIVSLAQRPFVTGVVPAEDGEWKPVTKIFDDGFKATLRSVVTEAGTIELSIDLENSEIGEVRLANLPIRVTHSSQADEVLMTVQVPTVRIHSVRMTAELAEGESLVFAVPRVFDPRAGGHAAEASATSLIYTVTPRKLAGTDRME